MPKTLRLGTKFVLIILTSITFGIATLADDPKDKTPSKQIGREFGYGSSHVDKYITDNLKDFPGRFNVSLQNQGSVQYADKFFNGPGQDREIETIIRAAQALMRHSYANPLIIAESGGGKSHLEKPLTMIFSYGQFPAHIQKLLQTENPLLAKFYKQSIGNTQIYKLDAKFLGLDPTKAGQRFPNQDASMKQVLIEAFEAGRQDFITTGRRTIFLIDEVAVLPSIVHQAMKTALDNTGFKDAENPLQKKLDWGISVFGITTPDEVDHMIAGDAAVQRRWVQILVPNMTADAAFSIGVNHTEDVLKAQYGGLEIDELALNYIIQMNDLLYSPAEAMPGSTLKALDSLYSWFAFERSNNGTNKKITLIDAQHWFLKQTGRTAAWIEGPNGEPPFYRLEEDVLKEYKGDDRIEKEFIHQVCMGIKAWGRGGYAGPPPVYFFGGITASGKNTVVEAINMALYGNKGGHQRHTLGANFEQLFLGEPGFGTYAGQLPLIVKRREGGLGPAGIVLDEGADAKNEIFAQLKVVLESGTIQPISHDHRRRRLLEPIFILGEWSGELFKDAKTKDEIYQKYASLTQEDIDRAFTEPANTKDGRGVVPRSVIQRAKENGGVFVFPPTPREKYPDIVRKKIEDMKLAEKNRNNLDLVIDDSLIDAIVNRTLATNEDARGLGGNIIKFVRHVIYSEAADKGFPYRNVAIMLSADDKGVLVTVVGGPQKPLHIDFRQLFGNLYKCSSDMRELKEVE